MTNLFEYDTFVEIQCILPSYVRLQLDPSESTLVDCLWHIPCNQLQAMYQTKSLWGLMQHRGNYARAQHLQHKDFPSAVNSWAMEDGIAYQLSSPGQSAHWSLDPMTRAASYTRKSNIFTRVCYKLSKLGFSDPTFQQ